MTMQKQRFFNLLMIIILCLGSLGSLTAAPVQASQNEIPNEQFVIAKVYYNNRAELDNLAARLDVWEVDQVEGYLVAMATEQKLQQLIEAGMRVEIDLARTEQIHQPLVPLLGQGPDSIPGYPCYRTVEETAQDIVDLAAQYPNLTELYDIGDSWEKVQNPANGYDITAMRITNENIPGPKPIFFLMAEIHARELPTAEMATRFIEYLLSSYETNADIHWMLDYYEVHVVPMVNPDGRKEAEGGQWWRKNTDNDDGCSDSNSWGTDLNRNYGFHWDQGGSDDFPCGETYHGPTADSEPETTAIENYVVTLFEDQRGDGDTDPAPITTTGTLITLHTYGELVLWPWGWTGIDAPNHSHLRTLGRKLSYYNDHYPQQSNDLYQTTGSTDDWSYGQLGIASFTFEMGTDFFQDCDYFQTSIYPKNRSALLYAFKATRQPYMDPSGPESLYLSVLPDNIHPGQNANLTATASDERFYGGGEPTQNIAAARYSIDLPSWIEGAVTYPMAASDGSFNAKTESIMATIDTSGLHAGKHTIFVESQDADGNWGVPTAIFLTVAAELAPEIVEAEGFPGQVITYTLAFTNGLATAKEFKVTATSDWEVNAPASLGTLGSMESAVFDVGVTIPVTATAGENDTAIVKVTQVGNVNVYDTSQLITTATANGVVITPTNASGTGMPGTDVIYEIDVANLGVLTDSFDLKLSSGWTASLSEDMAGPLAPGASESLVLTVSIPLEAGPGDTDTALITATSQSDPGIFAVATRTTLVETEYGVAVSAEDDSLRGMAPDTVVTYTLYVTNTGSFSDTFDVTVTSTWQVDFNTPIGPLNPEEGIAVQVSVHIPAEAAWGEMDTATLTFTSQGNPLVSQEIKLTTLLVWYNLFLPITVK
jgi:hypothetical protein